MPFFIKTHLFKNEKYHLNSQVRMNICESIENATEVTGKKSVVFVNTDECASTNCENQDRFIIFRTSLIKSQKRENERVLPYIWCDNFNFKPIVNPIKPAIGFCGAADGNRWHKWRKKMLEEFKDESIETNFILRGSFYSGKRTKRYPQFREEFVANLQNNTFNFCFRGAGNFSIRFYETLSAGRIPVLINSDTELPFENEINWNDKIIYARSVEEATKKMIYAFNNRDLIKMQSECRSLYEEYFTEEGFVKNLHKVIF